MACQPGSFSATGTVPCMPAPTGTFVDQPGATMPTDCPVGTFNDVRGAVECTQAAVGFYVDQVGAVEATACPDGTATVSTGSTSIHDCRPDADDDGLPDVVDPDDDGDGVDDVDDRCPAAVLPEPTPNGWKKNRYVADASGTFVDPTGANLGLTAVDTGGCSGIQVIDAAGLGGGHTRFGITASAVRAWVIDIA